MATPSEQPLSPVKKVTRTRKRLYDLPAATNAAPATRPVAHRPTVPQRSVSTIIENYTALASGIALIPVPFVEIVGVTTLGLRMLKQLCALYHLDFEAQRTKIIIGALLATLQTRLLAHSLVKLIPWWGMTGGMLTSAATAGAMIYALGRVFVMHFEAGGTILNFDPAQMRHYFQQQYETGRLSAA